MPDDPKRKAAGKAVKAAQKQLSAIPTQRGSSRVIIVDGVTRQQMGPEGPVQVARLWIEAIIEDQDLRKAWPLTHSRFRRELVAAWVKANRAHPDLVERNTVELELALAAPSPDEFLWAGFEQTTLGEFAAYWSYLDLTSWFMGHSKIQTTIDIYGHLLPGSHDEVRQQMDAYLAAGNNV